MSLRSGCFVLLCFKIQYKMILSEIPRNIIWGKDNRMLNELYSRACYFYPRLSSRLPCPRAAGGGGAAAAAAEPRPVLAGGTPGSRRKVASVGLRLGGTVPPTTWRHFWAGTGTHAEASRLLPEKELPPPWQVANKHSQQEGGHIGSLKACL